jgi:hypothetical protein
LLGLPNSEKVSKSDSKLLGQALGYLALVESVQISFSGGFKKGLLRVVLDSLQRWPVKELSFNISRKYAEAFALALPEVLPQLKFLKKLSLCGMQLPLLTGPLALETLNIRDVAPGVPFDKAMAALREAAPGLLTLTLDGEETRGEGIKPSVPVSRNNEAAVQAVDQGASSGSSSGGSGFLSAMRQRFT